MAPEGGATFAAVARDGGADATLWIERDPALDFATFEARSLDQLRSLAGSAQVVERIAAPTPEGTIVRLAADAPAGEPEFAVTAAGRRPLSLLPRDHGPARRLGARRSRAPR